MARVKRSLRSRTPKSPDRTPVENKPDLIKNIIKAYERSQGTSVRHSKKSLDWFRKRAADLGSIKPERMFKQNPDNRQKGRIKIGKLYFFKYDAKHKATLPYWDMYPLIFPFSAFRKNGKTYFMGLNLHYLPPKLRSLLFVELLKLRSEKRYRKNTRLSLGTGGSEGWELLNKLARTDLLRPCVKMYLASHVKSRFVEIPADEWEVVVNLQLSRFQKATRKRVWQESRRKMREYNE